MKGFLIIAVLGLLLYFSAISAEEKRDAVFRELDVDFQDIDPKEGRDRFKRDYGAGLGGPLAASGKKCDAHGCADAPKGDAPKATPIPKTKTESLMEGMRRLFGSGGKNQKGETPFGKFMSNFSKGYFSNPQEESRRRGMFALNFDKVQDMNKNRSNPDDAGFGLTEFSDLSHSELLKKFTGILPGGPVGEKLQVSDDEAKKLKFPPAVDWPALGAFPEVRYQGTCGSCYAFTTADLTVAQYTIETGKRGPKVEPLSPRYIQECGGEHAHGCTGGLPSLVMKHMSLCSGCGVPLETCYPYNDGKLEEKKCDTPCAQKHRLKWSQMLDVTGPHEKEIVASLLNWGPMLAIIACSEVFQFYDGTGVIKASQCDTVQNHAVLIVGYDYSGPTPYYLIRNSWGAKWGLKGYAKLEAGKNACAVAKNVLVGCYDKCADDMKNAKELLGKSNV